MTLDQDVRILALCGTERREFSDGTGRNVFYIRYTLHLDYRWKPVPDSEFPTLEASTDHGSPGEYRLDIEPGEYERLAYPIW